MGLRADGKSTSVPNPATIRSHDIKPGSKASKPISIKKKDDPQIRATALSSDHSVGPNASRRVPASVEKGDVVAWTWAVTVE